VSCQVGDGAVRGARGASVAGIRAGSTSWSTTTASAVPAASSTHRPSDVRQDDRGQPQGTVRLTRSPPELMSPGESIINIRSKHRLHPTSYTSVYARGQPESSDHEGGGAGVRPGAASAGKRSSATSTRQASTRSIPTEELQAQMRRTSALGRIDEADSRGDGVLASDASSYLTASHLARRR